MESRVLEHPAAARKKRGYARQTTDGGEAVSASAASAAASPVLGRVLWPSPGAVAGCGSGGGGDDA